MDIVKETGHPNRVIRDSYSIMGFRTVIKICKIKSLTKVDKLLSYSFTSNFANHKCAIMKYS